MFAVRLSARAERDLEALPARTQTALADAAQALAENPRPPGCRKLSGELSGYYRIRVGSCRIVYQIHAAEHVVLLTRIGPRDSVYR